MNDAELADKLGSDYARRLEDGRIITVTRMMFGKGRVNIGDDICVYDCW